MPRALSILLVLVLSGLAVAGRSVMVSDPLILSRLFDGAASLVASRLAEPVPPPSLPQSERLTALVTASRAMHAELGVSAEDEHRRLNIAEDGIRRTVRIRALGLQPRGHPVVGPPSEACGDACSST